VPGSVVGLSPALLTRVTRQTPSHPDLQKAPLPSLP
jgi:hypothetical protein